MTDQTHPAPTHHRDRGGTGEPLARLMLVRHAETVWHAENRYAGSSDVALTPHGREQAALLAEWAKSAGLTALWTSPLARARETAAAVAEATGLQPRVDARLAELDFGQGEGHTIEEMRRLFPDRVAAFQADPVANHLPGGEDPEAAAERGVACLAEIAGAHPGERVLIVAHTTLLRLVLCRLLDTPLAAYRRVFPFIRNCGLTEVRLDGHNASLFEFNVPIDGRP
jgi:broad specificity phosphatase PhoE